MVLAHRKSLNGAQYSDANLCGEKKRRKTIKIWYESYEIFKPVEKGKKGEIIHICFKTAKYIQHGKSEDFQDAVSLNENELRVKKETAESDA